MSHSSIITLAQFKKIIFELDGTIFDDYQIWLSRDEEGNEYLPMLNSIDLSIGIDKVQKKIVLFPSHSNTLGLSY